MKAIIIEDEKPASDKLKKILAEIAPEIELIGEATTVVAMLELLESKGDEIELILTDIKLKDGLSLEAFKKHPVNVPVIFITAYDNYALEAFRSNGVDYLLKPIDRDAVEQSIEKLRLLKKGATVQPANAIENVLKSYLQKDFKNRFMVKVGEHIRSVKTEDVAFFYAEGRNGFIVTNTKARYVIDYKMETLEEILNPKSFFRVNRTYIINIDAIKDVLIYSVTRLRIVPTVDWPEEIVVSREKVSAFKDWFNDAG
ncbi:MAG: LytTR family DNA-binding domain-containing protein [Imperialibacter sp.]|uniref:LytR/AlgR family response regulator transcription factor n=1 Tax=Imperialibacter sp. TaxID=2038411 RepID=UPI0032EF7676